MNISLFIDLMPLTNPNSSSSCPMMVQGFRVNLLILLVSLALVMALMALTATDW